MPKGFPTKPLIDRLLSRLQVSSCTLAFNGVRCLEWTGCRNNMGYGKTRFHTQNLLTHRLIWEMVRGPIPDARCVMHVCDNPLCCEVDHLMLGTHKDNMDDRDMKQSLFYGPYGHDEGRKMLAAFTGFLSARGFGIGKHPQEIAVFHNPPTVSCASGPEKACRSGNPVPYLSHDTANGSPVGTRNMELTHDDHR